MKVKNTFTISLVAMAITVLISAAGAYAFFNAKKTITTNKFAAGTLDLDVTSNENVNQPISIDNVGATEKIEGLRTWKIKNIGTLPGKMIFNLANIENKENGCNGPEVEAESECESNNVGELGKAIDITAVINDKVVATSTLENGHDFIYDNPAILNPGEQVDLAIKWSENNQGYGNEVQSDTVNFDMVFRLEQQ